MRTSPTIAAATLGGCMLASLAQAAPTAGDELPSLSEPDETPAAVYQRNLACAASAAALVARLPSGTSDTVAQEARDDASHERTFAIDAGARVNVTASDVDRVIARGRDELFTRAQHATTATDLDHDLGRRVVVCAFDHLGDAIKAAKAKRAADEAAK